MKMYRIKHKPTGLYFRPLRGKYSNLDSKGKIYSTDSTYSLLTNPDNMCFIKDIYFGANKGRSKKKIPIEYHIGMKLHHKEIPGVEIVYDSTYNDESYISIHLKSKPEDWEKEYVEVKVTVTDGED